MKKLLALALAAAALSPVYAQTAAPDAKPNILDKAVNQPGITWAIYGTDQSSKQVSATGVPGDTALRVTVSKKGTNPYDIGATYPTNKPIAAGDTILVAIYLRAPDAKGGTVAPVPIGATEAGPPYTSLAFATVQPSAEWKLYFASGVAPKGFDAGKAQASIQLAGAQQVLELGPVFILDFGQGYDPAKLPKN